MRVILVLAEPRGDMAVFFLAECLNIMAGRLNITILATCASGEGNVGNLPQTNSRQKALARRFCCDFEP